MWIRMNMNPGNLRTDDCTVRALSLALGVTWEQAYVLLAQKGMELHVMPDKASVVHSVLKEHGYRRCLIPDTCPDCYTLQDFCNDHPNGKFIVASDSHIVVVIDGDVYDTWDSTSEIPQFYWEE